MMRRFLLSLAMMGTISLFVGCYCGDFDGDGDWGWEGRYGDDDDDDRKNKRSKRNKWQRKGKDGSKWQRNGKEGSRWQRKDKDVDQAKDDNKKKETAPCPGKGKQGDSSETNPKTKPESKPEEETCDVPKVSKDRMHQEAYDSCWKRCKAKDASDCLCRTHCTIASRSVWTTLCMQKCTKDPSKSHAACEDECND